MAIKNIEEKPIVLFPINANPPNLGHIIAINTLLEIAQKIIVVVYDSQQVMSVDASINILEQIISNYKDKNKIHIIKSTVNFATLSEIPDEMILPEKAFTIATMSKHIYANLKSKGYPYLILIKKPIGWRDEYYKIAFMRSITLNHMENTSYNCERMYSHEQEKR